ncbi:unnamed protein product, partial [Rotaria sp. Silwood1]
MLLQTMIFFFEQINGKCILFSIDVQSTGGTPSSFTSFGLTGDLLFKPQISGIGGYVYSTISSFAADKRNTSDAYATLSGTSMATPYVAG